MTQPSCKRTDAYRQLQAADCMGYALTPRGRALAKALYQLEEGE